MKFGPISNKKSRLRFKEYLYNRIIINVYAQTERANQEANEHLFTIISNFFILFQNNTLYY